MPTRIKEYIKDAVMKNFTSITVSSSGLKKRPVDTPQLKYPIN